MDTSNDYPSFDQENIKQFPSQNYSFDQPYSNYQQQNSYPVSPDFSHTDEHLARHFQKFDETYEVSDNISKHKMMRAGFISKVYGILAFQLSITVASICFIFIPQVDQFFKTSLSLTLAYVAIVGSLITIIALSCCKSIARRVPINYILLILFTVCESYMLQIICYQYEPHSVLIAGVLTAAVTTVLALYALKTKTDYTACGAFLFCCFTILLIGSLISIFWRNYIFETLYACLGIVIYSIYLILDIQLISGKFGHTFTIDDYIMASMSVYIDIINLFVTILRLFGRKQKK